MANIDLPKDSPRASARQPAAASPASADSSKRADSGSAETKAVDMVSHGYVTDGSSESDSGFAENCNLKEIDDFEIIDCVARDIPETSQDRRRLLGCGLCDDLDAPHDLFALLPLLVFLMLALFIFRQPLRQFFAEASKGLRGPRRNYVKV